MSVFKLKPTLLEDWRKSQYPTADNKVLTPHFWQTSHKSLQETDRAPWQAVLARNTCVFRALHATFLFAVSP
jgi:hypothetical protein